MIEIDRQDRLDYAQDSVYDDSIEDGNQEEENTDRSSGKEDTSGNKKDDGMEEQEIRELLNVDDVFLCQIMQAYKIILNAYRLIHLSAGVSIYVCVLYPY